MTKRKLSTILVALLIVVASSYVACAAMFPSGTWRYKITVNVETPEGLKSGWAVREIHVKRNIAELVNPDIKEAAYKVFGEAVVIDLGKYGFLFSVIANGSSSEIFKAFPTGSKDLSGFINYYSQLPLGHRAILSREDFPWFVTFENLNDPQTIRTFHPDKGILVQSVVIQITDEPVSFGHVKSALPWVNEKKIGSGFALPGNIDQAKYLTNSDFIKGGN